MTVSEQITALCERVQTGQPVDGLKVKKGRVLSKKEASQLFEMMDQMKFTPSDRDIVMGAVKVPGVEAPKVDEGIEKEFVEIEKTDEKPEGEPVKKVSLMESLFGFKI